MARSIPCLAVVAALAFAGCGPNAKKIEKETSNLKPLTVLYGKFVGQHRGQPPASEAELKEFIKSQSAESLKALHAENPDSLFTSTRDKLPYVIVYGAVQGTKGPSGQPVVAFEQQGTGGKRYVAGSLGAIEEVDEDKFRTYVPSAK